MNKLGPTKAAKPKKLTEREKLAKIQEELQKLEGEPTEGYALPSCDEILSHVDQSCFQTAYASYRGFYIELDEKRSVFGKVLAIKYHDGRERSFAAWDKNTRKRKL